MFDSLPLKACPSVARSARTLLHAPLDEYGNLVEQRFFSVPDEDGAVNAIGAALAVLSVTTTSLRLTFLGQDKTRVKAVRGAYNVALKQLEHRTRYLADWPPVNRPTFRDAHLPPPRDCLARLTFQATPLEITVAL